MPLVMPSAELQALLDNLIGVGDAFAGAKVGLFVNDLVPTDEVALADLTPATFTGYALSAGVTWGASGINDQGQAEVFAGSVQFTSNGDTDPPETAYGYYVVDSAGTTLLWCERFAPADQVTFYRDNQILIVLPKFVLGNLP